MNPDRLAELEEELKFLLRSIDDLDREHAAGDVDEEDYPVLRDGYTARAATVMRSIDEGRAALPAGRRTSKRSLVLGVVAVIAIASGLGWFVAHQSGQRIAGQGMTGGPEVTSTDAKLATARTLLGSDTPKALQLYFEVLDEDPKNSEANTYVGWLLALSVKNAAKPETQTVVVQQSKGFFETVIAADPTYADAHCLYAVANGRVYPELDPEVAKREAQACLDTNPPAGMRGMVEQFVSSLSDPTTTTAP